VFHQRKVIRNAQGVLVLALLAGASLPAAAAALDSVQDALQDAVQAAVEDQVAEQVAADAARQVEEQVANQVASAVAAQAEASVIDAVSQQVVDQAAEAVVEVIAASTGDRVQEVVNAAAVAQVADRLLEDSAAAITAQVESAANATGAVAGGALGTLATAASSGRPFLVDVDAQGQAIEQGVLMLLAAARDVGAIRALGMTVRSERALPGLGGVLMRLEVDPGVTLPQAAALVRQAAAVSTIDLNHLYYAGTAAAIPAAAPASAAPHGPEARPLTIGVIDTAVETGHPALRGTRVVEQDFTGHPRNPPPLDHGTAIASVLAAESRNLFAQAPTLFAAGVFFEHAAGASTATTESIVQALSWMIENDIPVINMSLTGPANELLRVAVERAAGSGFQVVAAVGNNGPAGALLYPAAYPSVVGITAVDADHRIFMYANRGRHVTFSAPGVGVRVAKSGGAYADEDGTSLASAHAAVIIAAALEAASRQGKTSAQVLQDLKTSARDLGLPGFDDTFGYGLITPLAH
jgi:minor extracellular protease Epr